jgi:translation elongation factor EF-Ts
VPTWRKSSPRASAASPSPTPSAETIAKVGENMTLRRAAALSVGKGVVASYVHNSVPTGWAGSA